MFVDDGILVRVDVVSDGARWCGLEVREELMLNKGIMDGEGKDWEDGSGQGG